MSIVSKLIEPQITQPLYLYHKTQYIFEHGEVPIRKFETFATLGVFLTSMLVGRKSE